jgi:2-dehydropantoate 2-reductase
MLQDVLSQRRTEIDSINGAVVREGLRLGIPTPVNETLTRLVRTIEASYGAGV